MSIFWALFWIAILIVPAFWLAAFLWKLIIYLVVLVAQWLVSKFKGE